jgi:Uncharacterised nucleotidyltransferase
MLGAPVSSLNDPRPHLCAILRGESVDVSSKGRHGLLATAQAHRVDRLLAWRTRQITDELRAAAILDEVDVAELNRVLAGLEAHGVAPLVLKGAALAHTHYEESWLRPRVDADLLIPTAQRPLVIEALHNLGYTRPPFVSGELVMYQMPFARMGPVRETHLDVHWRIANPQILADLPSYAELAARASTISVRGQSMRTPCAVDALLLACVHRAAHHGLSGDLLWLYDIHLLAQRFTAREWCDFVTLASNHRVRALCRNGIQAACDCFHTSIPPDVMLRLTNDAEPERSAVYLKKDLTRLERLIADLRAIKSHARIRLLAEHLIPSASYISQKYDVRPGPLLPLFYLRRLVEGLPRFSRRV